MTILDVYHQLSVLLMRLPPPFTVLIPRWEHESSLSVFQFDNQGRRVAGSVGVPPWVVKPQIDIAGGAGVGKCSVRWFLEMEYLIQCGFPWMGELLGKPGEPFGKMGEVARRRGEHPGN